MTQGLLLCAILVASAYEDYYYYFYMINMGMASNVDYLLLVITMLSATRCIIYYYSIRMALAPG
jgi:hypothetical protein